MKTQLILSLVLIIGIIPNVSFGNEMWCIQHYNPCWRECHYNVSHGGALVWMDEYIKPNCGPAYKLNYFWNFDVIRISNQSPSGIHKLKLDPWIPYLPDFHPLEEWSIYEYEGAYPSPDHQTHLEQIQGWVEHPEWIGTKASFQGPLETRFVDQYYYRGFVGPSGGYYQARYLWDLSGLGYLEPSKLIGIHWPLISTPQVRPGGYMVEWIQHVHYEVGAPECSFQLEKWCKPHPLEAKLKSNGSFMCWLRFWPLQEYPGAWIKIDFPQGFGIPGALKIQKIKIWELIPEDDVEECDDEEECKGNEIEEYERQKLDAQLSLNQTSIDIKIQSPMLPQNSILVKYPIRAQKSGDHGWTSLIRIQSSDGSCSPVIFIYNILLDSLET